ncbi:NmrA-like family domain-containing protein 1 [Colletotrichum tanaceti]|uniref:NmrA-like family domain-containing protein 1 n=1 Tax=Colletotrichum tanaceti TaxID=1306861 RepID=A0A4U6XJR5_9PEZI|nr:NmrA-like family domain-containing protein 1 [Colletotrichum tanaceti]TKW55769.1 NmrA-like family domain-containing protein 1 [Colletotrichum tanaceti]
MSVIVVTGATGTQGGSVARLLAKNPSWKVRGITRNADSDKAKDLKALGMEMVSANLDDISTLPSAFEGAVAIFGTTNFWEIAPKRGIQAAMEEEEKQFANIADTAAKVQTLKHLVLSTMPSCETISGGKLPCPHWDSKARGGEYVRKTHPELAAKTTEVWEGWYVDNLVNIPMTGPQPFLGQYLMAQPSKPESIVPVAGAVELNTGIVVKAVLEQPEKTYGKFVPILTDMIPWTTVVEGWSKTTGKTAAYAELSDAEAVKLLGPAFGKDMAQQFRFSEQHPDWYGYHPDSTVSIKDLGIEGEVYGWEKALEYYKTRLQALVSSS